MNNFSKLAEAVVKGDYIGVKEIIQKLIDAGTAPLKIINNGLVEGMNIVGPKFKAGEMFVPDILMAAKAMGEGMDMVKSLINEDDVDTKSTVIIELMYLPKDLLKQINNITHK